jgi:hypothetical protein
MFGPPALRVGIATLPLLVLAACGGGSSDSSPSSDRSSDLPSTYTTPTPLPTETPSESAAAGAGADVDLHVSGAKTIDVSGHGAAAYCTYYFPADQQGININERSADFPGSGDWSLTIQGNDAQTVGLLLAIDGTQFSGNNGDDAATMGQGGTITVSQDVQQADFDMQLVNIVNHSETIKVKGSVHCG